MTKQELLDKYIPCQCWPAKDGGKVYNVSCPQHSQDPESAMDEWAKERVIEVLEWINKSGIEPDLRNKWIDFSKVPATRHTSEEVYNLFLQSIQP